MATPTLVSTPAGASSNSYTTVACKVCPKCGAMRPRLQRDHIVPRWKGGADDPGNIQYLCANCHEDKTIEDLRDWKLSPEHKAKISRSLIGNKRRLGSRLSERQKAQISARHRGQPKTETHKAKIAAALAGHSVSTAARLKMSVAARGRTPRNKGRGLHVYPNP